MKIDYNVLATMLESNGKLDQASAKTIEKLLSLVKENPQGLMLDAKVTGKMGAEIKLNISDVGSIEVGEPTTKTFNVGDNVKLNVSMTSDTLAMEIVPADKETPDMVSNLSRQATSPQAQESKSSALTRLGLPVTEANITSISLLEQYKIEPSAEKVKNLAEGSFLASKISNLLKELPEQLLDQKVPVESTLKQVAVNLLKQATSTEEVFTQNNSKEGLVQTASAEASANKAGNPVAALIKNEAGSEKNLVNANELEKSATVEIKPDTESKSVKANQFETLRNLKTVFSDLSAKNLLPVLDNLKQMDIETLMNHKLIQNNDVQTVALKHQLFKSLEDVFSKVAPSENLKSELIHWLSNEGEHLTDKAIEQLKTILENHLPSGSEAVKESFEVYQKTAQTLQELPQFMAAFQIPVTINQMDSQVELYIKRKNKKNASDDFKMLIALNTDNIDLVQAFITDQSNQLAIDFKVEDEAIKDLFLSELPALENDIKEVVGKIVNLHVNVRQEKEPNVLSAMNYLANEVNNQIDMKV